MQAWFFWPLSGLSAKKSCILPPAVSAQVSVNGTVTASLDLKQDTEITVTEKGGGYNKLIVRNGEVWCDSASCPDKVCVQQGKKSHNGDTIACLPNKMIVTIVAQ